MSTQHAKSATNEDAQIGAAIKRLRKMRRMSQETVGKGIGVSFQQVQKYENGSNRISVSRFLKLAELLDCDPWELIEPQGQGKELGRAASRQLNALFNRIEQMAQEGKQRTEPLH